MIIKEVEITFRYSFVGESLTHLPPVRTPCVMETTNDQAQQLEYTSLEIP